MAEHIPRWEYLVVEVEADAADWDDSRWRGKCRIVFPLSFQGRKLDELGASGWEVVGLTSQPSNRLRLLLKRPLVE